MDSNLENFQIRFVEVRGVRYLRAEDVRQYILAIAASEVVDVRNRLAEAAENLMSGPDRPNKKEKV